MRWVPVVWQVFSCLPSTICNSSVIICAVANIVRPRCHIGPESEQTPLRVCPPGCNVAYMQAKKPAELGMEASQNPFDMGGAGPPADGVAADEPAAPGALDANMFATPAADSYNPAGTGAQAPNDDCMPLLFCYLRMLSISSWMRSELILCCLLTSSTLQPVIQMQELHGGRITL